MQILEWVRFIAGAAMLLCGLVIFLIEVYGVFHLDYVLNRMHAAAMGDTLGISFSLVGLMIFCGLNFTTLKLALIVVFFWFASPVCSHMLSRLEVSTNENLKEHCTVYDNLEQLEEELETIKSEKESLDEASEGRQL